MKKSYLRFLGVLGIVGLLGFFTGNYGLFGFYGFFAFLGLGKSDEMLNKNLAKAGLNAFVISMIGLVAAITAVSILQTLEAAALFIAGIFIAQILTFVISFNMYEKRGEL